MKNVNSHSGEQREHQKSSASEGFAAPPVAKVEPPKIMKNEEKSKGQSDIRIRSMPGDVT